MDMNKLLKNTIGQRACTRIPKKLLSLLHAKLGITRVFMAGNSCNQDRPNDLDLYFENAGDYTRVKNLLNDMGCIKFSTRNAITVSPFEGDPKVLVQFCNYHKESLKALVESFDFNFIQVGVEMVYSDNTSNFYIPSAQEENNGRCGVYFSEAYAAYQITRIPDYTGTEYPLSSLLRLEKYKERGVFPTKYRWKSCMVKILTDVISRGYKNYADYKDQLNAVDLLVDDLETDEHGLFYKFFQSCWDRGLVDSKETGQSLQAHIEKYVEDESSDSPETAGNIFSGSI